MTDAFRNQRTPYVQPKTPTTPDPKPGSAGWKAFTEQRWQKNHPNAGQGPKAPKAPVATPTSTAMGAFRTALAQLNASTPQVDSNAIYAPYRASEQITGQLGQGLQQSELNSGQAAQNQYNTALGQAQQQAAQFGISAGAGANPTALQNTGTQPLAQQTNAYAAAAPQAATQWQQLLERTAAAKVSDAGIAREQGLTTARQSLAASLPTAIGNEEDRAFQRRTQKFNEGLALSQLDAKGRQFAETYGLEAYKAKAAAAAAAARTASTAGSAAASLAERTRHDRATEANSGASLQLRVRAKNATNKGLKGIPAALAAMAGTTSKTKPITGYKVTFLADPNGVSAGGPPIYLTVKDPNKVQAPSGYTQPKGTAPTPVYGQAGTTNQPFTASQWDAQMRGLLAQNPGKAKAIKAFLGPRPKN